MSNAASMKIIYTKDTSSALLDAKEKETKTTKKGTFVKANVSRKRANLLAYKMHLHHSLIGPILSLELLNPMILKKFHTL